MLLIFFYLFVKAPCVKLVHDNESLSTSPLQARLVVGSLSWGFGQL